MNHILVSCLPMLVCIFWTVTLLLEYIRHRRHELLCLSVFMAIASLLYVGHYVFFIQKFIWIPVTDTVYRFSNLAVFPLYLIYIICLTKYHPQVRRLSLFLLPAFLGGVFTGFLYMMMSEEETVTFVNDYLYGADASKLNGYALAQYWCHRVLNVVFGLQVILVLSIGVHRIREFRKQVSSFYADTDGRMLVGIRAMLVVLSVVSIASFFANMIGRQAFAGPTLLLALPSAFFAITLFGIGYMGMIQDFSVVDVPDHPVIPASEMKLRLLEERLDKIVREQRLYLKPDLKVSDLAKLLGTNEKYVSQSINTVLGQTFSEYINRLRIAYACQLMKEKPDMLTFEVAHKSGYAAISSFYRNMKLYSTTPKKD